jgi:hypothetical protein
MSTTLDRTPQLNRSQGAEIVAAQLRVIQGKLAEGIPDEPGGVLIEIIRDDLDECILRAIKDAKEPEFWISLMVAAYCEFMAKASFTALNEPPQISIERLHELIAALQDDLRDLKPEDQ